MLYFLYPVWLWAAAGVAVPIAIHLWNKKPPKTVALGSIQWLRPSKSQKLSSLHLMQPWLLLLRCLMVVLLALLLAGLHLRRVRQTPPEQHVYLHAALFHASYLPQIAPTVDSLAARGWRLHRLQPGFPEVTLPPDSSIRQYQTDTHLPDTTNAWALLRTLNRSLPAQTSAQVFSTDLLRHHRGPVPTRRSEIAWVPVSTPAAPMVWLQSAYYTTKGQLLLQFGQGDGAEVSFPAHRISKPVSGQTVTVPGLPAVRFSSHAQADSLHLVGGAQNAIALPKAPLQVLLRYSKDRQADARYLRAALQTALAYRDIAHVLTVSEAAQPLPTTAPQWVFWLSDEPLAAFLARFPEDRLKSLQDAPASEPIQKTDTWLRAPALASPIPVFQRIAPKAENPRTMTVWQDGFGQPLLTQTAEAQQTHYRFHSRFQPAWNGLPDSGHFPELLLSLLFPEDDTWRTRYDTRTLPENLQTPTAFSASFPENKPKTDENIDLKNWSLALFALLLAIERWLVSRSGKAAV